MADHDARVTYARTTAAADPNQRRDRSVREPVRIASAPCTRGDFTDCGAIPGVRAARPTCATR
eukprot:7381079-Prymnesium_polylepis.1